MIRKIRAWLWWRIPRLFMNRTQWAFWVMEQKRLLSKRALAQKDQDNG